MNRAITVYIQNKDGQFAYIGHKYVNHNMYRGDEAVAHQILHEKYGYRWNKQHMHYNLARKDIKVIKLPTGVVYD